MKAFILLISLCVASSSYAQISTTITGHRAGISLRGIGVPAISSKQITPLSADHTFSIKLDENTIEISPDQTDHTITGTITNLTDSAIGLNFHRFQRLASGWQTSVCFGSLCLTSGSDSGHTPFKFAPKESQAFILHVVDTVTPDSNGLLPVSDKDSAVVALIVDRVGGSTTDTVHLNLKAIIEANLSVSSGSVSQPAARVLSLYPNPATGSSQMKAQIYLPEAAKVSVAVYDLLGKEVRSALHLNLQQGVNVLKIDAAGLASGSYQLVCTTGTGSLFVKAFAVAR